MAEITLGSSCALAVHPANKFSWSWKVFFALNNEEIAFVASIAELPREVAKVYVGVGVGGGVGSGVLVEQLTIGKAIARLELTINVPSKLNFIFLFIILSLYVCIIIFFFKKQVNL